jgi:uncharacterized protein
MAPDQHCIAFEGHRLIAAGDLVSVALAVKQAVDQGEPGAPVMVFDAETSAPVEIDLRGGLDDVRDRLRTGRTAKGAIAPAEEPGQRKPGRPKLGVVGREVTLLPRHWDWLASQPGGASVALRRLVEQARRDGSAADRRRAARDACYRFMHLIGGDLPNYEEACRALFAGNRDRFEEMVDVWPHDIRAHAHALADKAI